MGDIVNFADAYVERRIAAALEADDDGEIGLALDEVRRALAMRPGEARAEALAAVYCALLDHHREALGHARRALNNPPVSAEIAYWAAVARHVVGAQAGALEALEIVLALEPEDQAAQRLSERCRAAMRG